MQTYTRQNNKYIEKEVYIIGNGTSRKNFNLNSLNDYITIGCNKIYKEYLPTKIASVCKDIIPDIIENEPQLLKRLIVAPWGIRYIKDRQSLLKNNCILTEFKLNYITSGNFAVDYALKIYRPKYLHLLGFDNNNTNLYYKYKYYSPDKTLYTDWSENLIQLRRIINMGKSKLLYKRTQL